MEPSAAPRPTVARQIAGLKHEPLLIAWGLFLFLNPMYIFKSGLPQPSDMLIAAMTPFVFAKWRGRLQLSSMRALRALIWFLVYVLLNALVWSLISNNWTIEAKQGFLMSPTFYLFDALTFLVMLMLYDRYKERFVQLTVRMMMISVVAQVAITFIYTRGGTLRTYGLFNSSNQLGYFAILSASVILLGQKHARMSTIYVMAGLLSSVYLALLSASRAALVSAAIMAMIAVMNRLRTLLAVGAVAAFFLFIANPFESAIERSRTRIQNDVNMSFTEERGYDRLARHPEYLVLGAGEGWYGRWEFESAIGSHELHSSAGTLLFCYGIVGLSLFGAFLWQVMRGASLTRVLMLIPPAADGLTHNGLRFTLFWVLLAIVVMLNDLDTKARKQARLLRTKATT